LRVRITESGPGCVYEPGSLIRLSDKKALKLIEAGKAISAEDITYPDRVEVAPRMRGNPFMEPPRWICRCGQVFKDEASLKEHRLACG